MVKTLRITTGMRSAYRVNTVLYCLRQIPLVGKWIPASLYGNAVIKVLVQVIAIMWEIATAFGGKVIFLGLMVFLPTFFLEETPSAIAFMHIFLLLTLVGARLNNYLVESDETSYYTVLLMGMDARRYSLVHFGVQILKLVLGYVIFGLVFGLIAGAPWWMCLLMPLYATGAKCTVCAQQLAYFRKTGKVYTDDWKNNLLIFLYGAVVAAAYFLPLFGIALPLWASAIFMLGGIAVGGVCLKKLLSFPEYRAMHQYLWQHGKEVEKELQTPGEKQSRDTISAELGIASSLRGFAYLNDLFTKRHKKIMWGSSVKITLAALAVVAAACFAVVFVPELGELINGRLVGMLPMFAFVMYAINRGTTFTQALFMNCDHSLLTYSFYKQPKFILKLFRIRLMQIIRVNLLPALVIALGLPVLLYLSGGTENVLDYGVLFATIVSMSVFFSTHYLILYYLLQPYNAGSELKNGIYQAATGVTYFVCYMLLDVQLPTLVFGALATLFCVLYCVIACVLVYFLAPKTFRIRQ